MHLKAAIQYRRALCSAHLNSNAPTGDFSLLGLHVRLSLVMAAVLSAGCGGAGTSLPQSANHPGSPSAASPAPQPSGTVAVAGPIVGVDGGTINLNGGPNCGYVNVSYNSSTTIAANGNALAPGTYAKVYGSGSCATSFAARAIALTSDPAPPATPSPGQSSISQTHVLTGDYLGGTAGTHSVSWSSAAAVLSWAEVSIQDATAISAASIKTMEYVDPFEQAASDPLYSADESTFSHDCSGNRVYVPYGPGQWLMNPASSSLASLMNSWQDAQEEQGHIDAFFYDNIDDLYGVPTLPCNMTQSLWDTQNSAFIGTSGHPVVFNGYAINSDSAQLINAPNVIGAMVEECYGRKSQPTPPYTSDSFWVTNEDLELAAGAAGKLYFCYNTPTTDASESIPLREYIYASFLIGYNPSSSILWEYFWTPSGLHVFPEVKLVPMDPLVPAPSSVTALQSGGVYVREYGECYLAGASIGRCAAVVNSSSSSSYDMPSLAQAYAHTMALSGYGALDGGTISATGPPPPSSLPPDTGVVLIQ